MRELFDAGAVGDLVAITGSICAPPMNDGWTASPAAGGGPLLYLGCHLVDLLLWFAGAEPAAVSATVAVRSDTGCDGTSACRMEFAAGPVAQLLVTQSAAGFSYEFSLIGTAGWLSLRGRDFTDYTIEVCSTALPEFTEPAELRPDLGADPVDTAVVPEIADFAEAVQLGRAPSITASDARRVLRVLDAVRESGRRGGSGVFAEDPMLAAF
jgi:predicted dehydrogenase